MPRSCSSSDMAGTAMLDHPGTDGAAVTDVRLHGSRPSQHPESRNTRKAGNIPEFSDEGWERDDSAHRTIVLPGDLAERLAAEAGRRGISLSDVLIEYA